MATKSILKNVTIKNRRDCKNFISALENASAKSSKEVVFSKPVRELKNKDDIRKMFGSDR